jgi:hypothetical protein
MARVAGYAGGLVFFSLCYVVVRWVLQLAALRVQANDLKELGNRRASARTRNPATTNPPSGIDVDRPALPRGGQPALPARPLAILHRDAGDAAALASAPGGEAMDVRAANRAPADSLNLQIRGRPEERAVQTFAPNGANQPFHEGMRERHVRHGLRSSRNQVSNTPLFEMSHESCLAQRARNRFS